MPSNTDGINPESLQQRASVAVSVGDDCITIKSGRDLQGRKAAAPCQNITITNCTMLAGHGGVVIGSEMSGEYVRWLSAIVCLMVLTELFAEINPRSRGVVEDIRISNVVMRNIKNEAIVMDLMYNNMPARPLSERTPIFRDIHVSD